MPGAYVNIRIRHLYVSNRQFSSWPTDLILHGSNKSICSTDLEMICSENTKIIIYGVKWYWLRGWKNRLSIFSLSLFCKCNFQAVIYQQLTWRLFRVLINDLAFSAFYHSQCKLEQTTDSSPRTKHFWYCVMCIRKLYNIVLYVSENFTILCYVYQKTLQSHQAC